MGSLPICLSNNIRDQRFSSSKVFGTINSTLCIHLKVRTVVVTPWKIISTESCSAFGYDIHVLSVPVGVSEHVSSYRNNAIFFLD